MTKITHLVVNGDSFTYCTGLENRETQGWPYLLSKDLGCEVVNLAIPGTGNDTIHRRVYEYTISSTLKGNRPFFVIGWSQFWRKETWFDSEGDYRAIGHPGVDQGFDNEFQKAFLKNYNDEDHARRTYLYKASLICLFRSLDLPYLMSDYSSDSHTLDCKQDNNEEYYDKILDFKLFCHDKLHISPFCDLTENLPKTACRHDGIEGNIVIKNFILDKIHQYYGNIEIDKEKHVMSLCDFEKNYRCQL